MEKTYNINGTSYTVNELIAIMREQLPGLKKYSHFADAEIEFCRQNKEGALFFYVSKYNGEDMMVKLALKRQSIGIGPARFWTNIK